MPETPPHVTAIVAALKLRGARPEALRCLTESQWQDLLPLCDMMHLTIPLRRKCGDDLPDWVRSRIDQNICDNTERYQRIKTLYLELANALRNQGVEHLVLKGFTQSPAFVDDPRLRMQSDIDLFCPPEWILRARDALCGIGYASDQGFEHQPTDHLPTLRRKTSWSWRGNYFDPEMPVSVELHFRFWNEKTRLRPRGLDQFWARHVGRRIDDFIVPALSTVDSVGYSAMHVFHHLRGELIPHHVYELSHFLHTNADNQPLWREWSDLHDASLRRLEAVCFSLAVHWFDCQVSPEVEKEIACLPAPVRQWFRQYSDSPLYSLVRPNKDALWLHLSMLESVPDKLFVFCGGLFPVRLPPVQALRRWSLRAYVRFLKHSVTRVAFHLRSLPRTIWAGLR
jgi:hypothetical protein